MNAPPAPANAARSPIAEKREDVPDARLLGTAVKVPVSATALPGIASVSKQVKSKKHTRIFFKTALGIEAY